MVRSNIQQSSSFNFATPNTDSVLYTGNNTIPLAQPADGIDTIVLLNGDRYDWNGTAWVRVFDNLNTQILLHNNGTIKHSLTNQVRWTNRLITMTRGSSTKDETVGYHDIYFPADGDAIPIQGGGTRAVVAATVGQSASTGGIPLATWETLWYKIIKGTNNTSLLANFLITTYTTANTQILTNEWIKICSLDDVNKIHWFNGDTTEKGTQFGGSLADTVQNWTSMKQKVSSEGYFFSPAGLSTVPLAFGFTGGIRWINGGQTQYVNNQGYVDCNQTSKVAGTTVYGISAANRTWRLMSASERPEWFGGATLGNNPILAASTTVVDLNDNEALFYAPNIDNTGVNTGTWYVVGYANSFSIPSHWLPIAAKQVSYSNSTIQLLTGGVITTLKSGDAKWMASDINQIQMLHHSNNVSISGERYTRLTSNPFFTGTAENGVFNGQNAGAMISWDDNGIIYGISEGYASWGNQYSSVSVPPAGSQIPIANNGAGAITRQVVTIGLHRYIPLAAWEALWYIPSAYIGGNNSSIANFIVTNYATNHYVPAGAVCIAKLEHNYGIATSGNSKIRVRWADRQYTQTGISYANAGFVAEYDHSQGNGDWRAITVAGSTPQGGNAIMPDVAGVQGAYASPYNPEFIYVTDPIEPKGTIRLSGLIQLNGFVSGTQNVGFINGVNVRKQPIISAIATGTTFADAKPIQVELRFVNASIGGQNGVAIQSYGSSLQAGASNWIGAGTPSWISLDNIILNHA